MCAYILKLQWVLLATIKSGDHEKALSILQEKYMDLDLNCQDYVCKLTIPLVTGQLLVFILYPWYIK